LIFDFILSLTQPKKQQLDTLLPPIKNCEKKLNTEATEEQAEEQYT
jgi:hypothetical protein